MSRLDETPGRLVDAGTHGSPLHELFQSDVVLQAVKLVPSFAQNVKELAFNALQGLPGVGATSTRSKSQPPIAENPEKNSGV